MCKSQQGPRIVRNLFIWCPITQHRCKYTSKNRKSSLQQLFAQGHSLPYAAHAANMADLLRFWEEGKIRPRVSRTFPLERAQEAFAVQESGRSVGKVIIRVGEPDVPRPGVQRRPAGSVLHRQLYMYRQHPRELFRNFS